MVQRTTVLSGIFLTQIPFFFAGDLIVPPGLSGSSMSSDIGLYIGEGEPRPDDEIIARLLKNQWKPPAGYQYPFSQHKKSDSVKRRYIGSQHLEQYPWVMLSHSRQGLFCNICPSFAKATARKGKSIVLGALVRYPLTKFSKLLGNDGDLQNHENSSYHKDAELSANDFLRKIENPETQLINQLDSYRIEQIKENGQNIALRWHRDDGPISLE